jgi:hypothetical protein
MFSVFFFISFRNSRLQIEAIKSLGLLILQLRRQRINGLANNVLDPGP